MGTGIRVLESVFDLVLLHMTQILVFLLTFLVVRHILAKILSHPNLPPGPRPWPLLGNILQLGNDPHKALAKLATTYGGIMTIYLGPMCAVVLSDLEVVKEAMVRQGDVFSNREQPQLLEEAWGTKGSVLWGNGETWMHHRRMIHNAFRHLGFRRNQFHSAITSEIDTLCTYLETKLNGPIDIRSVLNYTTANVICTVSFGQTFNYEDQQFSNAVNSMFYISQAMSGISLAHVMPKLYHTPLYTALRTNINTLNNFLQDNVKKHRHSFNPENIWDIVDMNIFAENPEQEEDVVWREIFDLFTAGSETTADSMLWAILYMMIFPEVQKKVHDELDSFTTEEIFQYPENTRRLPFTYATLLEVHRHQSVAPLSVPRVTSRNTQLRGYEIPKGTSIWVNEWAIHNDPTFWGDPEVFRPSRFLDDVEDEKRVLREKTQHLILFGYGKRQCLGKRLAEMEMILLFCGLLKRFTFSAPPGAKLTTAGHFGLTYTPLPFKVTVERR